jgi:hypothetical protein
MWWEDHMLVSCGHFKNHQSPAGERSPMRSVPFRISRAAEHRDVTSIGLVDIVAACPRTKPNVVTASVLVRDGTPLSNPQI